MTLLITQRCLDDWTFVFINQRSASGTCHSVSQSVRQVYLVRVWFMLWVTVSVWWVISWLTDSVLNDWWGGWFGRVRLRPWGDKLNPSLVYRLNIKLALSLGFVTSSFFLSLLAFPPLINFLMSHFHRLCLCARCCPLWLFLVNFAL